MKKIISTLCIVAMVALVATSCKKKNEEGASFTVNVEETTGWGQAPSIDDGKAYLDPNNSYNFTWNEGDKIRIYNLSSTPSQSFSQLYVAEQGSEGKTEVRFFSESGDPIGGRQDLGYFVFFNGNNATGTMLANGNREKFVVSPTQNFESAYRMDKGALALACRVADNGASYVTDFTLSHIFGFLNIGIADNAHDGKTRNVSRIEVEDASWNLAGELTLKLDGVDPETFSALQSQLEGTLNGGDVAAYQTALARYLSSIGYHAEPTNTKMITLNCNNEPLTADAWEYFIIPIRPGALYTGCTIRIYYEDTTIDPMVFDLDPSHPETNVGSTNTPVYVTSQKLLTKAGHFTNFYVNTKGAIKGLN
jgi:hypothetical protein